MQGKICHFSSSVGHCLILFGKINIFNDSVCFLVSGMGRKVALVTGANRGIGFYVAKKLLKKFPGDVILAGRNSQKGQEACRKLHSEGLNPIWQELDVTQPASARMIREFIEDKYGGIDVLVCNAGAIFPKDTPLSMHRQAELSVMTNFQGSVSMCKLFLPLLRPHGRIVLLSSELGLLSSLSTELRKSINLENITLFDLDQLAVKYLAAIKADVWSQYGWPARIMEVIGIFQNILAYIIARDLKNDQRRNILVNAGCPGITATDDMKTYLDEMGRLGDVVARQPEEAAEDIAWLALLPTGTMSPNGNVVKNKQIIDFVK